MRLSAKELAEEISRFVNTTSSNEFEELAKLMAQDHPTLQQSKMRLFCLFIEEMAKKQYFYCDARNQDSVDIAEAMIKGYKDSYREKIISQDGGITESFEKYIEEQVTPSKGMGHI